jgi:hypothetical protein
MSTPATVVDPWLDPFVSLGREGDYYQDLTALATEQGFGVPDVPSPGAPDDPGAPLPIAVAPPAPDVPEPELDGSPKVFQVEGGGTLSMEKGSKGWQATLNTGIEGAREQVFYGKTKDELLVNFGKAQLNATKKIRSQDQRLKLGDPAPAPTPSVAYQGPVTVRELTADERFEFKTIFDADPIRAMDFYNEKRYGMKPEQFAQRLNDTTTARKQTVAGLANATASLFVRNNPDFYPDAEGVNYLKMVRYLGRQNLNRAVTKDNASQTVEDLQEQGFWSLEALEAAKDDLNESGLLLTKPAASTPAPTPVAVAPQPEPVPPVTAPVPPRVIPPVERPRAANLGLRVTGNAPPSAPETAPSVDDPSNLTDAELDQVMLNLKQSRIRGR